MSRDPSLRDEKFLDREHDRENVNFSGVPVVSVIITAYGDCSTLPRAIESVLGQSYGNLEIIVVDDNGESGLWRSLTESVMSYYGNHPQIHYVKHSENKNGSAARNTGIAFSTGKYITFLDSDDYMLANRVAHAVAALEDGSFDACLCDVLIEISGLFREVRMSSKAELAWKDVFLEEKCLGTGSNLFLTRRGVEETGLFDTSFLRNQDIEYMVRYLVNHRAIWLRSIDLVKSENATDNEQSYDDYRETKRHFDDVFRGLLNELDESEMRTYLVNREKVLLYFAMRSRSREGVLSAVSNLKNIGAPLSRKEKYGALFRCRFRLVSSVVVRILRTLHHIGISMDLDKETKSEIARTAKVDWAAAS